MARCHRCTLPAHAARCPWCGHDATDPLLAAELADRRAELQSLRADGEARRAWLAEVGAASFVACPACGHWGRFGLCERCGFDQTDRTALDALDAYRTGEARRVRQAEGLLGPRGACARCWLPVAGPICGWCGHDNADAQARRALAVWRWEVWDERRRVLRDRGDRRAWRKAMGDRPAFMTCPNCSQRSRWGMCEWCDFDATDDVAVAARAAARAGLPEPSAGRRAELRRRITGSGRRQTVTNVSASSGDVPAGSRPRPRTARRFMTCPLCHSWSSAPICDWCEFDNSDELAFTERDGAEGSGLVASGLRRRVYAAIRGLIRFDIGEHGRLALHLLKWIVLGGVVGVLAGLSSAGFLETLDWATKTRLAHPWLLFLLPLIGFAVGMAYRYGGGRSAQGNNLIIDEIHEPRAWIPRRMAPLVYAGTILTHLFGGSAGREGTAIQMSGGLTDWFCRITRISPRDRRLLLIAAISGGFGAVFGVPIAGCIFGLEVQAVGRMRYDAIVPALTAPIVGDLVVRAVGVHHTAIPHIAVITLSAVVLAKVALGGLAFGLTSVAFSELTHGLKRVSAATVRWSPARPLIGGALIIALTYLVGTRDYNGLSIPLITASLAGGAGVVAFAFALKLLFTSVTLGTGFQGGEVTPLFVIGATLGASLGHLLNLPVPVMAALGFVAVFAGATNTPLACTIMGVELFGSGLVVLLTVACVVSYVFSSHRGIYGAQRVDTPKGDDELEDGHGQLTLNALARRRRLWLPARPRPNRTRADPASTDDERGER